MTAAANTADNIERKFAGDDEDEADEDEADEDDDSSSCDCVARIVIFMKCIACSSYNSAFKAHSRQYTPKAELATFSKGN